MQARFASYDEDGVRIWEADGMFSLEIWAEPAFCAAPLAFLRGWKIEFLFPALVLYMNGDKLTDLNVSPLTRTECLRPNYRHIGFGADLTQYLDHHGRVRRAFICASPVSLKTDGLRSPCLKFSNV
jgi:hypothetical protein